MKTDNVTVLLAYQRARHKAVVARVDRIRREKLGAQTATREVYRATGDGPLDWLFDGQDPDVVVRDSRMLKKILHIFKTTPRLRRSSGRSIIQLSNGGSVRSIPRQGR